MDKPLGVIELAWLEAEARVLPPTMPHDAREGLRRMFYLGAVSVVDQLAEKMHAEYREAFRAELTRKE